MPTIRDRIRSRLATNPGFVAVATGGVWSQPLVPPQLDPALPDHPGQTDAPFDGKGRLVNPAVVVTDEGESEDPTGPDLAFQGFPLVWFYARPTQQGKDAIASLQSLATGLLHRWQFATDNGTGAETRVVGRLGVRDAPEENLPAVVDYLRLQVVFIERQTF
jgi:hypothetical protein